MMFNVFVDHPVSGTLVDVISVKRPYDASAVANLMVDRGFSVSTDLHDARVPDAMVSPAVYAEFGLDDCALLGSDA